MGIPDNNQIDAILARTNTLLGRVPQQLALRRQAAENLPAMQPDTNFGGDLVNSALNQASFNLLNLPHGNGVGSTIGTGAGGIGNVLTIGGLLGLTPLAPEVTVPVSLGLAGLLGGGSQEARTQYNQSGHITDPGAILGQGAIEGALNLIPGSKAESLGRRLLTDIPLQAGAGVAGDAASQLMRGQPYNPGETGNAGAMGAGMGIISALLGGPHAAQTGEPPAPLPIHQLPGQGVAGLLPAPAASDHGFTGTPPAPPLALPGAPNLLTTGANPLAQAQNLLSGTDTPLLTGRRVVTTADGKSTFSIEPNPQPGGASPHRLAGDGGVLLKQGTPDITDLESHPVIPDAANGPIHEGEVVQPGPQVNETGYAAPETINSPVAQVFKNRSSALRGAKNLGLDKAEVLPVQTGPGEWMIHKVETPKAPSEPVIGEVTPAPAEAPVVPETPVPVAQPVPEEAPVQPVPVETPAQPVIPTPPAPIPQTPPHSVPLAAPAPGSTKPESVARALQGLDPKDSVTVHDFDLSATEPGTKIDGLGTFKGFDPEGSPIISRKGGLKRPGESGFAHAEPSLASVFQQAGDLLKPDDKQMLQKMMQDVQSGQATQFVGRSKQGRSASMAASTETPGTMAAFGGKANDRVLGVYYKPATAKTPAQVVARTINSLGEQATRIIRDAGNPDVGFIRTGSAPMEAMHSPSTVVTAKRSLASDAEIQKAGVVRQAAIGTKHEAHPIVQRLDQAVQSNNVKDLQQALRDFDRLPPEIQKKLGVDSGCMK